MKKPLLATLSLGGVGLAALALSGLTSFASAQQVTGVTAAPPADATGQTVIIHAYKKRKAGTWIKAESQHFVVYSDTQDSDVATLLNKLERFRYMLRSFSRLPVDATDKEAKTELYYLAHDQDLEIADPDTPPFAIGLYKSCEDGVQAYGVHMYYAANAKVPLEKQPENEGLSYIFQAYARHFFYQHSQMRVPLWFINGYAQYFSTARIDGNTAVIGLPPHAIGVYLQSLGRDYTYNLDYNDILLGKDSGTGSAVHAAAMQSEFEARAWILTHYILSSHDMTAKFQAYIAAISRGDAPVPAFAAAFGYPASQIHEVMFRYMHGDLAAVKLNFKTLPEAEISLTPLPPSAEKLLLWSSALKACPTAGYGATLLRDVRAEAAKYPDGELAQMALARAEIGWGDPAKALPYLQKATHDAPGDFEAHYLLGRAELAPGGGQNLAAASQAFQQAATLDPLSASNAYAFYRAEVLRTGTPSEDAMGAALLASQLAPEVDAYLFHAGLVYAHLGRRDDALHMLHAVADNPHTTAWTALAREWVVRIDGGAQDDDLLAAMKTEPLPAAGQKEWTAASADILKAVQDAAAAEDAAAMGISVGDTPADPGTTPPGQ